ncbi:MAG: MBL fold metallo-hydrolase [Dongiaceae bacterium]
MDGTQLPKAPIVSRSETGPEVVGFFHRETCSVTYLAIDPKRNVAALIDAVLDYDGKAGRTGTDSADAVLAYAKARDLRVEWVLETHVHADHLAGGAYCRDALGAQLGIGGRVTIVQEMVRDAFDLGGDLPIDGRQFDRRFEPDETFRLGSFEAKALSTPGHTPACVTYLVGDAAFVGDTLFMPDYGTARCDFPGGSAPSLYRSIQRLFALPDGTRLFTAHDYAPNGRAVAWESDVATQRRQNLHIGGGIAEADFVAKRQARDKTLETPALMLPALQVNVRGGRMPAPAPNGRPYLKIPVNWL